MTATISTVDRTSREAQPAEQRANSFRGDLYRFHGFTVLDSNGKRVGIVDWIWTNAMSGEGDHIGLQLQWLRGKARAVPATGTRVDMGHATVWLPFTKRQMVSAPRFRIDRALSSTDRAAIADHFAGRTRRIGGSALPVLRPMRSIAGAFRSTSLHPALGSQSDRS